jgi:hypothetical protein
LHASAATATYSGNRPPKTTSERLRPTLRHAEVCVTSSAVFRGKLRRSKTARGEATPGASRGAGHLYSAVNCNDGATRGSFPRKTAAASLRSALGLVQNSADTPTKAARGDRVSPGRASAPVRIRRCAEMSHRDKGIRGTKSEFRAHVRAALRCALAAVARQAARPSTGRGRGSSPHRWGTLGPAGRRDVRNRSSRVGSQCLLRRDGVRARRASILDDTEGGSARPTWPGPGGR